MKTHSSRSFRKRFLCNLGVRFADGIYIKHRTVAVVISVESTALDARGSNTGRERVGHEKKKGRRGQVDEDGTVSENKRRERWSRDLNVRESHKSWDEDGSERVATFYCSTTVRSVDRRTESSVVVAEKMNRKRACLERYAGVFLRGGRGERNQTTLVGVVMKTEVGAKRDR